MSFDPRELKKIIGISHYEERPLYNLILLKNPKIRIFYLTSEPIGSEIIEYYWHLLQLSTKETINFELIK